MKETVKIIDESVMNLSVKRKVNLNLLPQLINYNTSYLMYF